MIGTSQAPFYRFYRLYDLGTFFDYTAWHGLTVYSAKLKTETVIKGAVKINMSDMNERNQWLCCTTANDVAQWIINVMPGQNKNSDDRATLPRQLSTTQPALSRIKMGPSRTFSNRANND